MKRKAAIIGVIFVLILLIISLQLSSKKVEAPESVKNTPEPTAIIQIAPQAETILTLSPNSVDLSLKSEGVIDVNIDTKSNEVTGVQLELEYDNKLITDVTIKSAGFFNKPVELKKVVNQKKGRITYMLAISTSQQPVKGKGKVAQITFSKSPGIKQKESVIAFVKTPGSESLVSMSGVDLSVLKSTQDTRIILGK